MKTKKIYFALFLLGFISWSCTNKDELSASQGSLKVSMNANVSSLTTAMNAITSSPGYQVLAISGTTNAPTLVKSSSGSGPTGTVRMDTISLSDIAGIYDYKASKYKRWRPELFNFFSKTGTSTDFIVKLPDIKVTHPGALFHFEPKDTLLANNYVIDVSKYNYQFGHYLWNYNFASTITISNVNVGALTVLSSRNKTFGQHFSSDFAFANGYYAKTTFVSGDTIVSDYNISKGGTIYFDEKYTAIKSDTASRHREKQYSLTIGNVMIVRNPTPHNSGLDSAKVYVNNVLQTKATVQVIDVNKTDTTEFSIISHNRDLKITFDDGTTTTVNQLLGSTLTNVRTLFTSLRQVYFATNIVDWVAWDIALNKNNMGMGMGK